MNLHDYKDMLGKPNEGFHTHVGGIAIMDVLATIITAIFITQKMVSGPTILSYLVTFIILFIAAEWLHYIFGVQTVVTKKLGLN